ncbi:hypothetical protein HL658_02650 [Azospirillum sp. RWY-5-1]|uniref:PepSY domain-containing protein n=1 Tax=Azospirillum oleiclasticum TaxID=2735135 RepID=A0ABX2T2R3_9PROT|nr:PepSY domain-containing protein [Azospirillum oleiclasticum]NYZ11435.1 hypothetical protein [Azospirillum oleiclasticum]NYZ18596.1 hypothetical protein [Azospirillum oleiclasticum]
MRSLILPAFAIAALATGPALAQSGQSGGSQSGNKQATSQNHAAAMSQDTLRKQLQQAGFKNIQVIDAAYLVQAQTQDGNTVFMTINPPSMSGSSGASGSQAGAGSGSASGSAGKSDASKQ